MKKTSFARDLFSHTDWLPEGFVDTCHEQEEKNLTRKPEELSRKEALGSMKSFTDKVLDNHEVEKVILDNIEVSREKSQSNYIIHSYETASSWKYLEKSWAQYPLRLADLKSKQNTKILFIVHQFLQAPVETQDQKPDPLSIGFEAKQLELFTKMVAAMKIDQNQIAVSAVSADLLQWSDKEALDSLHHEINVLNPRYIVCFGAMATHALLQKKVRLSLVQGEFFDYTLGSSQAEHADKAFKVMPLFHPEYLLINPNMKRKTWDGMKKIMESL